MGEVYIAALLCGLIGGAQTEKPVSFDNQGLDRGIRIDCETPTHSIEIGLDQTASARDSIHQAVFASTQTGRRPMVIMIDRDGVEGRYEQEMRIVAEALGIEFQVCKQDFILRWASTSAWRKVEADDLPSPEIAALLCDLGSLASKKLSN